MARFPLAMRHDDGDEPTIRMVIRSVTPSLIEKDEAFITQERIHLGEADFPRRIGHLFQKFEAFAHSSPPPLIVEVRPLQMVLTFDFTGFESNRHRTKLLRTRRQTNQDSTFLFLAIG
jgi:hypothetical protein